LSYSVYSVGEKAIDELNKALNLDPNYPDALNIIAYEYMNLKNFDKAVEYLKRYAAVQPGKPNPFDSLAEAYRSSGLLAKAFSTMASIVALRSFASGMLAPSTSIPKGPPERSTM
jgi:predicted Zn-dependent protease